MTKKTVLITGTSTGIGAACVARQAAAGWKVYAGVRKPEDGERLRSEIAGNVVPVIIDVTRGEDIDKVLAQINAEVGSLDGLVNNAGIGVGGPIELLSDEDWQWQFDVNFFSLITLTRQAMPLVDKANGRFVHIGSIAGRIAAAGLGPYAASKHAIEAFNWALRGELARNTGMTSSVVEPGEIKTAIWEKADQMVGEVAEQLEATGTAERYGFLVDGQRGFIAEGQKKGVEPDKVAKAVEHALSARRPKARYLVGPDAKAVGVFGRLPDRLLEGFMNMNGKRLERAGRKAAA
ncbi:MAG: SDR family NAD(P)-dependent oxidoreductase [Actinomycetia bacterium]|nr:SDR family NAD(P)-dependent oxidoreductase [Actinomycetes bacterium]